MCSRWGPLIQFVIFRFTIRSRATTNHIDNLLFLDYMHVGSEANYTRTLAAKCPLLQNDKTYISWVHTACQYQCNSRPLSLSHRRPWLRGPSTGPGISSPSFESRKNRVIPEYISEIIGLSVVRGRLREVLVILFIGGISGIIFLIVLLSINYWFAGHIMRILVV